VKEKTMSVRAKFKCIENRDTGDNGANIRLEAVYGNGDPNHENSQFFKWTPSGTVNMGVVNASAAAQFEVGKEYYVDFTPCGS
jgi:hypothetical protein